MTDIYLSNSNLITDEDLFQQSISIAMDFFGYKKIGSIEPISGLL